MTVQDTTITFQFHPKRRDFQDLTGRKFHRLTALGYVGRSKGGISMWACRCDCGKQVTAQSSALKNGTWKSCGCYIADLQRQRHTTHGLSYTPTWRVWKDMRRRCNNPHCRMYRHYGGRGIMVCERWQNSFENFLADMGERPSPKHSIDRIDNDGDYTPENCRWAIKVVQDNNKRTNHLLTFNGKTQSRAMWARECHINYSTLKQRLEYGWTVERALTTPVRS